MKPVQETHRFDIQLIEERVKTASEVANEEHAFLARPVSSLFSLGTYF